jgi:hypothetical protein
MAILGVFFDFERPLFSGHRFARGAMNSILNRTQVDSETVGVILAAVRCMARLSGDCHISLRIALMGEECTRCRCISEMFIEPVHVCTVCWSTLIVNAAVASLKAFYVALDSGPNGAQLHAQHCRHHEAVPNRNQEPPCMYRSGINPS